MDAAIELQHVSKIFGKFPAVDDLSFRVPYGVAFGLLGPNGAGKTTTIRMIMNITAPDSGEIRVLGSPMSRETQTGSGTCPGRGLYRDEVVYHLTSWPPSRTFRKSRRRLAQMGGQDGVLAPLLTKRWTSSPGGCNRSAVHRKSADPEMLMDEPFSGLDPITTPSWDYFRSSGRGANNRFSTHVPKGRKLCDEICLSRARRRS